MHILFTLLILVLIAGAVWWILTQMPIPQPFKNAALIILGIICIIYLVGLLSGHAAFPAIRW